MPNVDHHAPGSFCWIELGTTDQNAAKNFYGSLFGWKANDFPMGPNEYYTMFQLDGRDAAAGYSLRADQHAQGVPPHWMLYIAVASADEKAKLAGEKGGKAIAPPFDVMDVGRMAVLQDPTGATFSIWEAKRHKGTGIAGVPGTLCWADLSTPDPDRAKQFYSDAFNWKISTGEGGVAGYLHIQNGEEHIGGIPPLAHRMPNVPPHWLAYFLVSKCDESAAKARQLGASLFMPPTNIEKVGRMAIVADPQGAIFAIFEPLPRA
ncbi:MAG: VOC family protein [Bryobacteraceae bacterium]